MAATYRADTAFAWVNQGGATVAQGADNSALLTAPAAAGHNWRIRAIAIGKTQPYTLITSFWPILLPGIAAAEMPGVAVGWRDSATGKLALVRFYIDYGTYYTLMCDYAHWTSPTVLSAVQAGPMYAQFTQCSSAIWVKLADDGTNRTMQFSPDGVDWTPVLLNDGRTNFLTADQLVFGASANNANYAAVMKLRDWYMES